MNFRTTDKPDYQYVLKIWSSTLLTEKGQEEWDDAVAKVDLANEIEQLALDLLNKELPHMDDGRWLDWYTLKVEEIPYYPAMPPGRPEEAPEGQGMAPAEIVPPAGS